MANTGVTIVCLVTIITPPCCLTSDLTMSMSFIWHEKLVAFMYLHNSLSILYIWWAELLLVHAHTLPLSSNYSINAWQYLWLNSVKSSYHLYMSEIIRIGIAPLGSKSQTNHSLNYFISCVQVHNTSHIYHFVNIPKDKLIISYQSLFNYNRGRITYGRASHRFYTLA